MALHQSSYSSSAYLLINNAVDTMSHATFLNSFERDLSTWLIPAIKYIRLGQFD
jgi:hypothetical protein